MDVDDDSTEHKELEKENDDNETRSRNKNPFLINDGELSSHPLQSAEDDSSDTTALNCDLSGINSESTSTFTDSFYRSENDSLVAGVVDGDFFTASMMTSGVECFDSSDIEIIKEDRGSGDSIEILETSTSSSVKLADVADICDRTFHQNDETAADFSAVSKSDVEAEDFHRPNSKELFASQSHDIYADEGIVCSNAGCSLPPADEPLSRADTPLSNTSDSSHSGAVPNVGYSKLQESNPSSYSPSPYESPTHSVQSRSAPSGNADHMRPDSLSLPKPMQLHERQKLAKKESYSSLSEYSSRSGSMDALIEAATSTPLNTQGTVSVDGEMITFVAHGINELIKKSRETPPFTWSNDVASRSRSSSSISSTTSGWSASVASHATRSPSSVYTQSPDDIPPIDPKALFDIELHARKAAESLDALMQNLVARLHRMSLGVHDCLDVYKEAVDKTCDAVDTNIKSMYALMAKCEELSRSVRPVYQIQDQIKEIKRLLDLFESQLSDGE